MDTIKSTVQFAGNFVPGVYAYQLVVQYKDQVYYSERMPRQDCQAVKNNLTKMNLQRYVDRGVLSTDNV